MTTARDLTQPDGSAERTSAARPGIGPGSPLLGMAERAAASPAERPPLAAGLSGGLLRAGTTGRRPRAWASPIARPAARIAVAGGLAVAGWLLGAVLSQANAATDESADRPAVSTQDDGARQHAGTATSGTLTWAVPGTEAAAKRYRVAVPGKGARGADSGHGFATRPAAAADTGQHDGSHSTGSGGTASAAGSDSGVPAGQGTATGTQPETTAGQVSTAGTQPETSAGQGTTGAEPAPSGDKNPATGTAKPGTEPATQPAAPSEPGASTPEPESQNSGPLSGLLGGGHQAGQTSQTGPAGLLGGLLGLVNATVDSTVHTTLTSVDTVIETTPATVIVPPVEDVLEPVAAGSGSASGSVTATVAPKPSAIRMAQPAVEIASPVAVTRVATPHLQAVQPTPVKTDHADRPAPVEERTRAGGGGSSGGGGGLPDAPAAPVAPASTASAGHDGSGGLRQPFAVTADDNTVTQLKLIGVSRDREVAGVGRDAALPTTSPD